jgi:multidrug transporter EmrE-like cation transporter
MTKVQSGIVLVSGPIVSAIGGAISSMANNASSTPQTDWYYSLWNGVGMVLILVGVGMFFFGAMRFSQKEK